MSGAGIHATAMQAKTLRQADTVAYYDTHAETFFSETRGIDMSELHRRFLASLPPGGHILDAGCGSGRDSKAFTELGYRVTAFDASAGLVALAQAFTGIPIAQRRFADVHEIATYDGIWACASLLHLAEPHLIDALQRLWRSLKPNGTLYLSFKYGDGEREHNGRHFIDATENRLTYWSSHLAGVASSETWITIDQRPGRDERWLNGLIRSTG